MIRKLFRFLINIVRIIKFVFMKKFMRKFSSHEEFENEKDFEYPYVVWDGEHIHYGKKPKDEETDEPETPEDPTDEPEVPEVPETPETPDDGESEVTPTPDEPTDYTQPNNEIWYTSIDDNIVEPSYIYHGEKPLNTYVNGKGVMRFKNDVTNLVGLFFECDTLLSVSLPNGLMSISNDALSNCDNLKTIKIPNSVTEIKYCTFGPSVDIYYDGTRPQWDEITIQSSILLKCTIHCTDGDIHIN